WTWRVLRRSGSRVVGCVRRWRGARCRGLRRENRLGCRDGRVGWRGLYDGVGAVPVAAALDRTKVAAPYAVDGGAWLPQQVGLQRLIRRVGIEVVVGEAAAVPCANRGMSR